MLESAVRDHSSANPDIRALALMFVLSHKRRGPDLSPARARVETSECESGERGRLPAAPPALRQAIAADGQMAVG